MICDMSVCYDGIGALESGNHTTQEFLKVMDKTSGKDCPRYLKSLKCKSCKKYRKTFKKETKEIRLAEKNGVPFTMSKKLKEEQIKLERICNKCRKTTRKCNLKMYLTYSGAHKGNCPK